MLRLASWPAATGMLLVLLAVPVRAQDILTVEQATRQAIANNAGIRASRAGVAERDARIDEARASWFPRVSVTEAWQRGNQPVFVFSSLLASRRFGSGNFAVDALNHPDAVGVHRTSIVLQQLIFDRRQGAEVDRTILARDAATLTLTEARATLALATVEVYGRVVASDASRRAALAAHQAAQADRARAADRRDAGMATDADVLALEAHIAALAQRVARAEGENAMARADLNRLMGAPIDRVYQLVAPTPGAPAEAVELAALLAEADARRPAVGHATLLERLARTERRLARASLLPRVTAQGGLEVNGMRFDTRASSWLVGAEVSWSLSLGGAERASMAAAAHAEARAVAEADEARALVHAEVVAALAAQRSATARLAAGGAAVDQARESERIVRDRFEAGLAGVTDLLRAQGAVLDADAERTASAIDAMVSAAELARAVGRTP